MAKTKKKAVRQKVVKKKAAKHQPARKKKAVKKTTAKKRVKKTSFKPTPMQTLTRYANEQMFEVHRGALSDGERTFIFGNDGFGQDRHAQREVELLREILAKKGIGEIAFTVQGEDDYTWGMLVEGDREEWAIETAWACWNTAWLEEDTSEDTAQSLSLTRLAQLHRAIHALEGNRGVVSSLIKLCPRK